MSSERKKVLSEREWVLLICLGYAALFVIMHLAMMQASLWLATLVNCLVVKTIYILMAAFESNLNISWQEDCRHILLGGVLVLTWMMVFGAMVDMVAYAAIMEVFLYTIQFPTVYYHKSLHALWVVSWVEPRIIPIQAVLLALDIRFSEEPVFGKRGASSEHNLEPLPKNEGIRS